MSIRATLCILLFLLPAYASDAFAQNKALPVGVKSVVYGWSLAHNNGDAATFKKMYAGSVWFYGQQLTSEKCIDNKLLMLKKWPDFNQTITSEITCTPLAENIYKCRFDKTVLHSGKRKIYPSYLVLQEHNGSWQIIGESDLITDRNLGIEYVLPAAVGKPEQTADSSSISDLLKTIGLIVLAGAGFVLFYFVIIKRYIINPFKEGLKGNGNPEQRQGAPKENTGYSPSNEERFKERGDLFEQYIAQRFDPKYFTLIDWRSDKHVGNVFPESNMNPDLEYHFTHKEWSYRFAVECKYRHSMEDGFIEVGGKEQLKRYKEYEKKNKLDVFIALGLGGKPDKPGELLFIPLKEIKSPKIPYSEVIKYRKSMRSKFFYDPQKGAFSL